MGARRRWTAVLLLGGWIGGAGLSAQRSSAEDAILQFQRAADSYAFVHRQADRRGPRPLLAAEGALFTPAVAAVLRERIRVAIRSAGCRPAVGADGDFSVPHVNETSQQTQPLPACLVAVLPKLPVELEYRSSGVTLVLADAHLLVVVDVLHGAFPAGREDDLLVSALTLEPS